MKCKYKKYKMYIKNRFDLRPWLQQSEMDWIVGLISNIKHVENACYCIYYWYYLSWSVIYHRQYYSLRLLGAYDFCVLWSSVMWAAWKYLYSLSASSEGAVYVCRCEIGLD